MGIYGYGKAFNLRYAQNQYRPTHVRYGQPRQPIIGNQSYTENTNITIKNGPSGFWGFMSGFMGGLFGGGMGGGMGMGMGGFSPFGMINSAQAAQPQQQKTGDRLADLQKMYPDWNITSDGNGKYDAVNKDQTKHVSGNFDEMCESLLKEKQGAPSTPTESTPTESTPTVSTPTVSTPTVSTPKTSTPTTSTTTTTNTNETKWTAEEKAKPHRFNITLHYSSSGAGTGTVVTPDGKTYKVNTGTRMPGDDGNEISRKMLAALKEAGWTNVTLENKNFNWASDGKSPTGEVEKPQTKELSAEDKAKPQKMTISFAVHSGGGVGNSGSATVTTPDGKLYQVSTGVSLTATRARKDLAKQMQEALKAAGWTNVTLENKNFSDWQ